MAIRAARLDDASAMSAVLIASITQLCTADHADAPTAIADWTANKTPEMVGRMLEQPGQLMLVAERNGAIAGVGLLRGDTIGLNYVDPAHRFTGTGTALLTAMEAELRMGGVTCAKLVSTATARGFYLRRGWLETGPSLPDSGFPMQKQL